MTAPISLSDLEAKATRVVESATEVLGTSDYWVTNTQLDDFDDEDAEHIAANSPKVTLALIAVVKAALAWSECREEFQLRQTFSLRERLDLAGDALVDALKAVIQ